MHTGTRSLTRKDIPTALKPGLTHYMYGKRKLTMFVFVLQGARGNDGAAGAAGPPVSLLFPKINKEINN